MLIRRRAMVRGAVIVMLIILSGCSFLPRVGVRSGEGRKVVVEMARCENERITSVELHDGSSTTNPLIWRIESPGQAVDEVVIGVAPPGFQETVPLADIVRSDSSYRVVVHGARLEAEIFVPGQLEPDRVQSNGTFVPLNDFRARAGGSCGIDFNFGSLAAFAAVLIVFGVMWVFGIVFWIVKIVEVARIPEYQYRAAGSEKVTWVLVVVLTQLIGARIWHFGPRKRVRAARGWAPSPPPGWYPAPGGGSQWWDGQRWVAPPSPPPPL